MQKVLEELSSSCTVGAVKIYVAAMEAIRKKERHETQFPTKIGGKTSLGPSYFIL
jgi:hypothetical protein